MVPIVHVGLSPAIYHPAWANTEGCPPELSTRLSLEHGLLDKPCHAGDGFAALGAAFNEGERASLKNPTTRLFCEVLASPTPPNGRRAHTLVVSELLSSN